MATQSDTVLAVQRTVKALDRVSQNLDVFFAELEERAQPEGHFRADKKSG
jgi:hypothetical protein